MRQDSLGAIAQQREHFNELEDLVNFLDKHNISREGTDLEYYKTKNTAKNDGVRNSIRLTSGDLNEYLNAGGRKNKNKIEALKNNQKIILTSKQEIVDYINNAIDKNTSGLTVAYGKVNDRLLNDVKNYSDGKVNIEDYFLEIVPFDMQHAYEGHHNAREEGDVNLSRGDFERLPEYLDTYDELLYVIKYSSGQTKICVSKKLPNGRMLIIETVSKSRGSLQFKNAIGVTEEKYQNEYLSRYKKRNSKNTRGNIGSNNSLRDLSVSNTSLSQEHTSVNNNSMQNEAKNEDGNEERNSLRDNEYLEAVNNGDMETAQRMVDEYAEEVFANSKIRDEDGKLLKVYHGTYEDFTVFDKTKGRTNMDIQGMFFSPWDIDAKGYGPNVRAFYLNITNPANESTGYKALHMYTSQNNAGVKARNYLEKSGFDGVNNENEEFIAFNSEQIKSADPVTYDDNGNIIPLSKRFDVENEDIRFSKRGPTDYLSKSEWASFYASVEKSNQRDAFRIGDNGILIPDKNNVNNYKLVYYSGDVIHPDIYTVYKLENYDYNIHSDQVDVTKMILDLEKSGYNEKQTRAILQNYYSMYKTVFKRYNVKSRRFVKLTRESIQDRGDVGNQSSRTGVSENAGQGVSTDERVNNETLYQPRPELDDHIFDDFDGEITTNDARLMTEYFRNGHTDIMYHLVNRTRNIEIADGKLKNLVSRLTKSYELSSEQNQELNVLRKV